MEGVRGVLEVGCATGQLLRYFKDAGWDPVGLEPTRNLARDGELMVSVHKGFWQPMDTYREMRLLNDLWTSGKAPWKARRQ